MIKYFWKLSISVAVVGVLAVSAFIPVVRAQTSDVAQVYILNIKLDQTTVAAGGQVTGSFIARNLLNKPATEVMYDISLAGDIEKNGFIADTVYDTKTFGPIFLNPNESKEVKFQYTLPPGISGSGLAIEIQATQAGAPLGWSLAKLSVTGSKTPGVIFSNTTIAIGSSTFGVQEGPTIHAGENAQLSVTGRLKGATSLTLTPQVTINAFGSSKTLTTFSGASTPFTSTKDATVSIDLPTFNMQPGVYEGSFVLLNSGQQASPAVNFRYIVAGHVYSIRNIQATPMAASAGQPVNVQLFVTGQSPDLQATSTPVAPQIASVTLTLFNERGAQVGSATQDVDFNKTAAISIPITLTANAAALRITATATVNGQQVAHYEDVLSGDFDKQVAYAQQHPLTAVTSSNSWLVGVGALALSIILLIIVWFVRRRSSSASVPPSSNVPPPSFPGSSTMALMLSFVGAGLLFFAVGPGISHAAVSSWQTVTNQTASSNWYIDFQPSYPSPVDSVPNGAPFTVVGTVYFTTCGNAPAYLQYGYDYNGQAWTSGPIAVKNLKTQNVVVNGKTRKGYQIFLPTQTAAGGDMTIAAVAYTQFASNPQFQCEAGAGCSFTLDNPGSVDYAYIRGEYHIVTDTMPLPDASLQGQGQNFTVAATTNGGSNNLFSGWSCDKDSPTSSTLNQIFIDDTNAFPNPSTYYSTGNANSQALTQGQYCGPGYYTHQFNAPVPPFYQDLKEHWAKIFVFNINGNGASPYDYCQTYPNASCPVGVYNGTWMAAQKFGGASFGPPAASLTASCPSGTPTLKVDWNSMTNPTDGKSQGANGYKVYISTTNSPTFPPPANTSWVATPASQNPQTLTISNPTSLVAQGNQGALTLTAGTPYYAYVYYPKTTAYTVQSNPATITCSSGATASLLIDGVKSENVNVNHVGQLTWTSSPSGNTCAISGDSTYSNEPANSTGSGLTTGTMSQSSETYSYTLTCSGPSGQAQDTVTATTNGGGGGTPDVTVTFDPNSCDPVIRWDVYNLPANGTCLESSDNDDPQWKDTLTADEVHGTKTLEHAIPNVSHYYLTCTGAPLASTQWVPPGGNTCNNNSTPNQGNSGGNGTTFPF